ncbi:hypothetical protein N4R57_19535 [Rhodobacteraceae bacterium D3-12]|nr:hypothetical protein N4R57_19535 [Rhodobacteraceae bacterium D3-12]
MSRKFITLVVAASIAVSGVTASQVEAGNKRTRNIIAGAAALAIIGAAIADSNSRKNRAHVSTQNLRPRGHHQGHKNNRHAPKHGHQGRNHKKPIAQAPRHQSPRTNVRPRPLPPRVHMGALPNRCLNNVQTRRGPVRLYGANCLNRHYSSANKLPNNCRQVVRTRNGNIIGYNPTCVQQFRHQAYVNGLNRR